MKASAEKPGNEAKAKDATLPAEPGHGREEEASTLTKKADSKTTKICPSKERICGYRSVHNQICKLEIAKRNLEFKDAVCPLEKKEE